MPPVIERLTGRLAVRLRHAGSHGPALAAWTSSRPAVLGAGLSSTGCCWLCHQRLFATTGAAAGSSGSRWATRQTRDQHAKEAKVQGFKSRAAFKLLEVCLFFLLSGLALSSTCLLTLLAPLLALADGFQIPLFQAWPDHRGSRTRTLPSEYLAHLLLTTSTGLRPGKLVPGKGFFFFCTAYAACAQSSPF